MSKRIFNEDQIRELLANPNVSRCSDKSITYSKTFKVLAVKKYYEGGYSPNMIFKEAGFNKQVIGKDAPNQCLRRWKKIYRSQGEGKLRVETRGKHNKGGRPKMKGLTDAEKIKRMEIEIAYLKAEKDFFMKLRAAKKR
jgi:transposase-like protein